MMRKVRSQVKYSFTVVLRQDATAVKSRYHKSQENHTVLLELCFLEFSRLWPRPLCKCAEQILDRPSGLVGEAVLRTVANF